MTTDLYMTHDQILAFNEGLVRGEVVAQIEAAHNYKDAKGRVITGKAVISTMDQNSTIQALHNGPNTVEWSANTGEYTMVPCYGPDQFHYAVRLCCQRDGASFGATARSTYYSTLEQATAAAHKALAAQNARYAKMFA
jgi:hypothetical protein